MTRRARTLAVAGALGAIVAAAVATQAKQPAAGKQPSANQQPAATQQPQGPGPPAASTPAGERRYPANRAAELKARLLEQPQSNAAPAWAVEYATSSEVGRFDPVTRAAERLWSARVGLAASPSDEDRKSLQGVLDLVKDCPLDSVPVKRAAQGLTKIGVVVPLSGRYERYGKTFVNGLRVAIDAHNRDQAPAIHLILHDSEGDPLVGARKARWLLKDHGVSILVGEILSANTAPLAAATQVLGAVLISPSATNERLAILGDGVFQLHIGAGVTASALARHLAGESPRSSVGMLVARTAEDSLQAMAVVRSCDNAAVRVLGTVRVPENEVDVTKELAVLKSKRPTALVLVGPQRLMDVVGAQLQNAWPKARVFGFASLDPEALNREAREGLEGAMFFANDYALDGAARDTFDLKYTASFRESPTRMSVRGYLTGLAIAKAVEGGAMTAAMLRESLRGQLYDSDEGRKFRALRPAVPAFPERLVIRGGKAGPPEETPVDP